MIPCCTDSIHSNLFVIIISANQFTCPTAVPGTIETLETMSNKCAAH